MTQSRRARAKARCGSMPSPRIACRFSRMCRCRRAGRRPRQFEPDPRPARGPPVRARRLHFELSPQPSSRPCPRPGSTARADRVRWRHHRAPGDRDRAGLRRIVGANSLIGDFGSPGDRLGGLTLALGRKTCQLGGDGVLKMGLLRRVGGGRGARRTLCAREGQCSLACRQPVI